ncbi:hypothetical protein, partial [Mycobacterium leprae]|uniref:hypothetical protein n=2 Tax=Mycobacterium leprae TaxID=1769 RepID=UPI000ACF6DD3
SLHRTWAIIVSVVQEFSGCQKVLVLGWSWSKWGVGFIGLGVAVGVFSCGSAAGFGRWCWGPRPNGQVVDVGGAVGGCKR